ncbi:hypothetical protein ACFWP3_14265 [Streptomyces sp. NPDC058525]|uniref:hypothetical protein n=1 Tax=Streptomyces sp. NPDC058525 TaxID=3346538 RepID=UPI0036499765
MSEASHSVSKAEAAEIRFLHDGVKDAYCRSESLRLEGMAYLDATGASVWGEATCRSFERRYALLREQGDTVFPLVLFREQARRRLLGSDEELPGSAAVLTVDSMSSIGPGA